jgi:hypothetical protein
MWSPSLTKVCGEVDHRPVVEDRREMEERLFPRIARHCEVQAGRALAPAGEAKVGMHQLAPDLQRIALAVVPRGVSLACPPPDAITLT